MPTQVLSNGNDGYTVTTVNTVVYGLDGQGVIFSDFLNTTTWCGGEASDLLHTNSANGGGDFYSGNDLDASGHRLLERLALRHHLPGMRTCP